MAMVIKPPQDYTTPGEEYKITISKILKSIGLTDIEFIEESGDMYYYRFKFPDGTQVDRVAVHKYTYRCAIIYDFTTHVLILMTQDYFIKRPSPSQELRDYFRLCILPTTTGSIIDIYAYAGAYDKFYEIFNITEYPDYSNNANPSSCTLLPAYAGLPTGAFEILNCYVALNATYAAGTKFVDETGTKWVALGGPLLYKVPATD